MSTVVFTNANLIDGTGADPKPNACVVVEGNRIKEILDGAPGSLPSDAQTIDCQGKTLMPGLIDGHVHMGAVDADITNQQRIYPMSLLVIRTEAVIKETLDQGFTTARDCAGIDAGFRQAQAKGLIPGPRLWVSGLCLSQTGGHGDARLPTETHAPANKFAGLGAVVCDGVDAVRGAAREQLRRGVDFIKVMAGGGAMSPSDEINASQYSMAELEAIVWEAESHGTYVSAHCYSDRSILNSVKAGIKTIEHGNLMSASVAQAMKEAGAILVPTIITYKKISEMGPSLGVPANNVRKINQALEKALEALEIALKAGVIIGSGSDLLGPMQVFKAGELEMQAKVMGPMGAIVASTKTNAEMLGAENDLGTVTAGKLADLILVDGDPLADITILQKYQEKIQVIMQDGKFYKNII